MRKRVFFICLLTTGAVWGQLDTGVIIGSLRDQAGAVIPSGAIKIANQGTQVSTAVLSDQKRCRGCRLLRIHWRFQRLALSLIGQP